MTESEQAARIAREDRKENVINASRPLTLKSPIQNGHLTPNPTEPSHTKSPDDQPVEVQMRGHVIKSNPFVARFSKNK